MTAGIFRSVIVLPRDAEVWNEERQWFVLAHELAHIRRRDGILQPIHQLACALYWFNPLIWVASKRLQLERERACDDEVLQLGANADDYASHLLEIARDQCECRICTRGTANGTTFVPRSSTSHHSR
jgi:beta-lactamase regulating signal transducer with metallopeptidase domain